MKLPDMTRNLGRSLFTLEMAVRRVDAAVSAAAAAAAAAAAVSASAPVPSAVPVALVSAALSMVFSAGCDDGSACTCGGRCMRGSAR